MQKTNERKELKKTNVYRIFIELVAVGSITGIVVGAIVTLFNILVHEGEHISRDVYAYVRANPAFIPLLLLGLIAGAFVIGVLVNISSVIRGCGVPQAEGAWCNTPEVVAGFDCDVYRQLAQHFYGLIHWCGRTQRVDWRGGGGRCGKCHAT